MIKWFIIPLVFLFICLGALAEYNTYLALKKHYPQMTFHDYVFMKDYIRITGE